MGVQQFQSFFDRPQIIRDMVQEPISDNNIILSTSVFERILDIFAAYFQGPAKRLALLLQGFKLVSRNIDSHCSGAQF